MVRSAQRGDLGSRHPTGLRVTTKKSVGSFLQQRSLCTISAQLFAEHQVTAGSHPSYRHEEPASPTRVLSHHDAISSATYSATRRRPALTRGTRASSECREIVFRESPLERG